MLALSRVERHYGGLCSVGTHREGRARWVWETHSSSCHHKVCNWSCTSQDCASKSHSLPVEQDRARAVPRQQKDRRLGVPSCARQAQQGWVGAWA